MESERVSKNRCADCVSHFVCRYFRDAEVLIDNFYYATAGSAEKKCRWMWAIAEFCKEFHKKEEG